MAKNITEKNLAALAKIIGRPLDHGWKTKLQLRLNQTKPSILSTWIKRGMPSNFDNILIEAGIDPRIWENIEASSTVIEVTATENINMADVAKLNETTRPYNEGDTPAMPIQALYMKQADVMIEMQRTINRLYEENIDLHKKIHDLHEKIHRLASEIGEIKTNMFHAARSGDINRLWIGPLPDPKTPN